MAKDMEKGGGALTRYLPIKLNGNLVMIKDGTNIWRADNSKLKANTLGITFRMSKNNDDKDTDSNLDWGTTITGIDEGDGWIKVEVGDDADDENVITITFDAGPLGMKADWKTGIVNLVVKKEQAERKGVEVGMRMVGVNGDAYTEAVLDSARTGSKPYQIAFDSPQPITPAPQVAIVSTPSAPDKKYKSRTGFGLRKKLGIVPKTAEEKRVAADLNQQKKVKEAARQERKQTETAEFLAEKFLPWNFETKLAAILGLIKIPIIVLVATLGLLAENHLKSTTRVSWLREGTFGAGGQTSCYAHEVSQEVKSKSLISFDLVDVVNSTMGGALHGNIFKSNFTVDPTANMFGKKDTCNVDLHSCRVRDLKHPTFWYGGIDHIIPFALIWFVYKIVFIGVHPVDRIALQVAGNPEPGPDYPEPLMRLITEPYFVCWGNRCCAAPLEILVKILCYIRYKLAPNALLGALASMHDMGPQCPKIIYYKMDPKSGTACYFMCMLDLLAMVVAYVFAQQRMEARLISTGPYRIWKSIWMFTSATVANAAVYAAILTYGGLFEVLRAIGNAFKLVITLNFSIHLGMDMMRAMNYIIIFLESVELAFLIATILFPKVFKKEDEEDDGSGQYAAVQNTSE